MTLFGYTLEWNGKSRSGAQRAAKGSTSLTLLDIRPGAQASIRCFSAEMSCERWAHLQAYGLTPGRMVRVVQHAPVTVIQVEHVELALEDDLARLIEVNLA